MRLIKFCKSEHNIKTGCPTIQLGTFQYYREMDRCFCIADESEGHIKYRAESTADNPLDLTPEQWNAISGGVVQVTNGEQASPNRWLGPVHFSMNGAKMEFLSNGLIRYQGILNIIHTYPNAYIYCLTALDDGEEVPHPSTVDKSYDSYYELQVESVEEFLVLLGNLLHQSLMYQDIQFEALHDPAPLMVPSQATQVSWAHGHVQYVDTREDFLRKPADFEERSLANRYQRVIFEKEKKYETNKEYRFVFFVRHPQLGVMSVKKSPKILTINKMAGLLV